MVLISRPKGLPAIVRATLDKLEGRISQEELERRNRESEQLSLGIGSVTEAPKRRFN
jgi:hypothetical protein